VNVREKILQGERSTEGKKELRATEIKELRTVMIIYLLRKELV
jgi:hypothetical protein